MWYGIHPGITAITRRTGVPGIATTGIITMVIIRITTATITDIIIIMITIVLRTGENLIMAADGPIQHMCKTGYREVNINPPIRVRKQEGKVLRYTGKLIRSKV